MNVTSLSIPDVLLLEPKIFDDERGFFFESFNQAAFEKETNLLPNFVQENHSRSSKGVLRGLHYQLPPKAQDKLVRVLRGQIFDIAVDLRKNSPSFGLYVGELLSDSNKKQLWIPKGFAHGFVVISEIAEVVYKTTEYFAPGAERRIKWNDPDLNINWNIDDISPILSAKDQASSLFHDSEIF